MFPQGLGRLSEKVTVKVKPEDVPLSLRAHEVSTHSMTLSWAPPIRLNPVNYKVSPCQYAKYNKLLSKYKWVPQQPGIAVEFHG